MISVQRFFSQPLSWVLVLVLPLFAGSSSGEIRTTAPEQMPAPADKSAGQKGSNEFVVSNVNDEGEGSLRLAVETANDLPGKHRIVFDSETGPFSAPQTIILLEPLPELNADITIDARSTAKLWQESGVTVSGNRQHRVFAVGPLGSLTLRALTVADGRAESGAGIMNRGKLLVVDSTLFGNSSGDQGGAVMNEGGTVTLINSTFTGNRTANEGGGFANMHGSATVTNCTFSGNNAAKGGALFNSGELLLRNTILANSDAGPDCVSETVLKRASTHNLVELNENCGAPVSREDPNLQSLGYYNGPTKTLPINAPSPAINTGDNASAIDEQGQPLQWDQRGNGDPRFVGGVTDIGAFEYQRLP